MYYILLSTHTEITSDSAGQGLTAICGAGHGSNHLYRVAALDTHHYHRGNTHTFDKQREERTVNQVGIVLAVWSKV